MMTIADGVGILGAVLMVAGAMIGQTLWLRSSIARLTQKVDDLPTVIDGTIMRAHEDRFHR